MPSDFETVPKQANSIQFLFNFYSILSNSTRIYRHYHAVLDLSEGRLEGLRHGIARARCA